MFKKAIAWPGPDKLPLSYPEQAPHAYQLRRLAVNFLNEAQQEVLNAHSEEVQLIYSAKMEKAHVAIVQEWKQKIKDFEADPTTEPSLEECSSPS